MTPYFYDALETYEKGDSGIREAFAEMARNIDFQVEQTRFQQSFFKIPVPQKSVARPEVPQPPPAPPANPTLDLLKEAETAFNAGDNAKAQAAFEKVLTEFDRENGAAMYGMALIASRKGDSDEAKQYLKLLLEVLRPDLPSLSWLGRAASAQSTPIGVESGRSCARPGS